MNTIDSQNYYVQHGLVLPRQAEPVQAIERPRDSVERQPERLPRQDLLEAAPRVERFVRTRGEVDNSSLSLRSRQALDAYGALEHDSERDELSTLLGIDAYA